LRLSETLTLGERRFVAVIEFERQKFLIGGTGTSVAMLSALPGAGIGGQIGTPAPLRPEEGMRGSDSKDVPTWGFVGDGSDVQMVRR
jgi:flagellar biogenesis protein FliO